MLQVSTNVLKALIRLFRKKVNVIKLVDYGVYSLKGYCHKIFNMRIFFVEKLPPPPPPPHQVPD
jgi:hypothetical protein